MSLASDLLTAARAKGLRVATAESCTGGLVSGAITDVAGSSDIFDRGFVTYTNAAKVAMLGVSQSTLDAFGAVSQEVAREMALGALTYSAANITVSITGIAGPGASEFKPEGRVCFATATRTDCQSETIEFGAIGRGNVRNGAVQHALELLLKAVADYP